MTILSRLKIRTKLIVLAALSVISVLAMLAGASALMRQRMTDDRIDKARSLVQSVRALVDKLAKRESAGELTHDQALKDMRALFADMRYDNGDGYFFAFTPAGLIFAHGTAPAAVGTLFTGNDVLGRYVPETAAKMLATAPEAMLRYKYNKPGADGTHEKIAYFVFFAPWNLLLGTGIYVEDLNDAFYRSVLVLGGIGGTVCVFASLIAWLLGRDLSGSLTRLHIAMRRLAQGDTTTPIDGTDRRDEAGDMARAVTVFRQYMAQANDLAALQDADRERAQAEKHAALNDMANRVENDTGAALVSIRQSTSEMLSTADLLTASAARTGSAAQTAAGSASHAMSGAQTVAAATEQLTASIQEISRQVAQSTAIVGQAVVAGTQTRDTIADLDQEVDQIGTVATMIADIASKTNLLALNATIEAARAGEAGKGFAVVASEVKALASQTAKSTEAISRHIDRVRAATGASVAAVARIEATIQEVNKIANSIAAAVEQQGSATAEIARNVTETATAAGEMSHRTQDVLQEATATDRQAAAVRASAATMETAISDLRESLVRLVRTATPEVDRRAELRKMVDLACRVTIAGNAAVGTVVDMSDGGARLRIQPGSLSDAPTGGKGLLTIEAVGFSSPFIIVARHDDLLRVKLEQQTAAARRAA